MTDQNASVLPSTNDVDWYSPLSDIESKGKNSKRPKSLAGIHAAKRDHEGQFFTPSALARVMWDMVQPNIDRAIARERNACVAVLDNSIGSGRLVQYANAKKHEIYGCDIDDDAISLLRRQLRGHGFTQKLSANTLSSLRFANMGVALINPPFSLTLRDSNIEPLHGVSHGVLGEKTQAISHEYALAQALNAAAIVVALLPTPYAQSLDKEGPCISRLQYLIDLPAGSFREEKTEVSVSLAVYGPEAHQAGVQRLKWKSLAEPMPTITGECPNTHEQDPKQFNSRRGAVVTLPVTGITTVRVVKAKRKIGLQFQCGLMEAKVLNTLYRRDVEQPGGVKPHRYPDGVEFTGQGQLDIEVLMLQDDPQAAFEHVMTQLRSVGADVSVCASLRGYMHNRMNLLKRWMTPYRHVVPGSMQAPDGIVTAKAIKNGMVNPARWGSAKITKGEQFEFTYADGRYTAMHASGQAIDRDKKNFATEFELIETTPKQAWVVKHEGRCVAFPQLAKKLEIEARRCGAADLVSWDYQLHDLVEVRMAPGGIVAWEPGLGKGRLDLALALMGGKCTLICLEPHLIAELMYEIRDAKLPEDQWQIIESVEQAKNLKRINIISYNRLRMPIFANAKRTYAHLMRRRVTQLLADEGHVLANYETDQSRALRQISAKRRYVLTATPTPNMSRSLLPITQFIASDATAIQPYGARSNAFASKEQFQYMDYAQRGVAQFIEDFVTTEWVTYQFSENMQGGGKREIPRVKKPDTFRAWAASLVKRRVVNEPEVAKYIKTPPHTREDISIEWNADHLRFYLKCADDFAAFYRKSKAEASSRNGKLNMVTILARIGAVQEACTRPSAKVRGFGSYLPLTSKEIDCLEHVERWTEEGRKSIVYAYSPTSLIRLEAELAKMGIDSVRIDGTKNVRKRGLEMHEKFRKGSTPVLLMSQCGESGLNLPEASRMYLLERAWTPKSERQIMGRPLRPQNTNEVQFVFAHLEGSIDEYMKQMVEQKAKVCDSYLDAIDVDDGDDDFLHLEVFLDKFVSDLAERRGLKSHEMRERLKA